jgi:hypothetical protein
MLTSGVGKKHNFFQGITFRISKRGNLNAKEIFRGFVPVAGFFFFGFCDSVFDPTYQSTLQDLSNSSADSRLRALRSRRGLLLRLRPFLV